MPLPARRLFLVSMLGWCSVIALNPLVADDSTAAAETDPAAIEFFENKVRPILAARCYQCHSDQLAEPKGGLRLDSRAAVLEGGGTGPAVEPGKPDESLLVEAINYGDIYQMPPKSKLPAEEIGVLTRWVELGAPWPAEKPQAGDTKEPFDLQKRRASHWSWQPIGQHEPPAVQDSGWPTSSIDNFILARLEKEGLPHASPAEKRTLIRRVYFDLIGLPPTPAEVKAFLDDDSAQAFERVVDRLLASPHFGERWARHWLDLVRYAESRGHEFDYDIPNAWHYRDYVIRAFNADLPYNQFVSEHIAGDLLPPRLNPTAGYNESILGTGFWYLGEWVHSPVDIRQDEMDRFDDMIDVMGKTFLGLTIGCARCHDHKFDAISQADYYAVAGYLRSCDYRLVAFDTLEHNREVAARLDQLRKQARPQIAKALVEAQRPLLSRLPDYLVAAREALQGPSPAAGSPGNVEELAARHNLDAKLLAPWIEHLNAARSNRDDPFAFWAQLCHEPSADDPETFKRLVAEQIERLAERKRAAEHALDGAEVIVDFASSGAEWMQDGFTFGPAPVQAGELLLGVEPQRPSVSIAAFGSARRDPAWNGQRLLPETQNDPARLSKWFRTGRTLRTGTFAIEKGVVYYLVTGAGYAHAVVDSHRTNDGPLHAALIHQWKDDKGDGRPRWIAHDLRAYQGHRAHIELTADEERPMSVLMVVQADREPGMPLEQPTAVAKEALVDRAPSSLQALAEVYQQTAQGAAERLAGSQLTGSAAAASDAPLLAWVLDHPKLFGLDGATRPELTSLDETLSSFAAAQAKLLADIRLESSSAPAMWEGTGEDEHLLVRGNPKTPGDLVPRRFLEALGGADQPPCDRGSGRLELARQLTDPKNPLVARVFVNRLWQHLFGRGLVVSADDFGLMGQPPTHPELLDYLATRFVNNGWSTKRLLRLMLLSSTYQMASTPVEAADARDPENRLLHRMPVRRLEAEAIRDSILTISGRLDAKLHGPSVPVYLTAFMEGRGRPKVEGPLDGAGRRSIYVAIRRNFMSPMMLAFDSPLPVDTMGRRNVSNVPAQSLILMNDPFVLEQTRVWAKRIVSGSTQSSERITQIYESALGRPPRDDEQAAALAFLDRQRQELGLPATALEDDLRPWADLCHVVFNLKEFVFVE